MQMTGYTKLFGSIITSTIWREKNETRILWITMLALKNKEGVVEGSVPGLADMARLTLEDTLAALGTLRAPDPYSRTKEHDGRRIQDIDGGWIVLNHAKWRAKMNADERREYLRVKQQEHRAKASTRVNKRKQKSTPSTHTKADTHTNADSKKRNAASIQYEMPLALGVLQDVFVTAWTDFLSDRKERRKAVTSRAAKMILNRLAEKPERAVEAIRKMIEKGWTSFEWAWIDNNSFGKPKPPVRREQIPDVPISRR